MKMDLARNVRSLQWHAVAAAATLLVSATLVLRPTTTAVDCVGTVEVKDSVACELAAAQYDCPSFGYKEPTCTIRGCDVCDELPDDTVLAEDDL